MQAGLEAFVARHRPDELMITANVFEHEARCHSFEVAAKLMQSMAAQPHS